MIHMHKTIGKLRILYSNYNTQGTNQNLQRAVPNGKMQNVTDDCSNKLA